jgi:CheY-like chemotaxis protein
MVTRCCARLRENPATRDIPVIGISANAMPQDLERARAAGFADYLTKPLEIDRFLTVVESALDCLAKKGS